jgi:two-component system, chemotaxis family, CheB/CheR fusion protein
MPDLMPEGENGKRKTGLVPNPALKSILAVLSEFSGVDLLQYKLSTITRRLQRRMALVSVPGFEEYLTYIKDNESEQHIVFADLLIHVSSFFRDPGSFEYLLKIILPQVISHQAQEKEDVIRIWVAGCATGEEAYSLAICLYELIGPRHFASKVKIFATDLSDVVIAIARKAIYTRNQLSGVSEERLQQFFVEVEQGYQVSGFLRDVCVFASHNMLTDPPFAKLNLISCRNVLIYMQPVLQKKMLSIFNYALKEKGFLWLGKSETNRSPDLFEMPSKKNKIYLKKNVDKWTLRNAFPTNKKIKHMTTSFDQERDENVDAQKAADSVILSMYAPPAVLLNEKFDIVEFRGVTMQYFEHGPGKASLNVLKLAHRDLVHSLRSALNQAHSAKKNVKKEGITIYSNGIALVIGFEIVPISSLNENYYLVIFHQQTEQPAGAEPVKKTETTDAGDDKSFRILQLEKDQQRYKEELRAVVEAYEATNEELQSANEELKSLNEELEVSQEELQVINDELTTRNNDLVERNNLLNNARLYAEAIVNTVHESLIILDTNIRVVSANASFYRSYKTERRDTEGKLLYELGNKQWNTTEMRSLLENLLTSRTPFINYELTQKVTNAGERTMLLNGQLITSQDLKEELILLAIEDITEVKQARERIANKQEQIRINEERLRLALDGTKTGTWEFNPQTQEIVLSDRSRELFGVTSAGAIEYNTFIKTIHPADVQGVQARIQAALNNVDKGQLNTDFRIVASNDHVRWISCKAQVFFNEKEQPIRMLGVVTDVSENKQFEKHLQDVNNRLNFALETGRLGSWELEQETGAMICNAQGKSQYGLQAEDVLTYEKLMAIIVPEDKERVQKAMDVAFEDNSVYAEEYRIKWPDSSIRWVAASGQTVYETEGAPARMIGVTLDITERKQAQINLQQSEEYFRMIADTAPAMIWIVEKDGSFSFFNKAWQKYTGRSLDQDKDKGWYEIMHPEDIDKWKINFSKSSRDRRNFYAEFRLKRNDGTYHWLACSGIPRFTAQDEFAGFIGACTDIDDQKMVEDALERKVRERTTALEEANANLSKRNHELEQFVFITSHDLQEPLRKIRLFADMLESIKPGNTKVDTALYLRKVKQSAMRMSDLIRDLISYSRLELGEKAFLPVDLNVIAANVIEDFELLIKDKQAKIEVNELPVIDAVPLQMNQLFYNLIGNALKFSNLTVPCRVTITANKLSEHEQAEYPQLSKGLTYYRIIVADNGIGFNQAYADKLFVIFQRLNQKEKFEGTGIGLALCRKIMDIHNGDILAFGIEHQGAQFHILIPENQ